MKKMNGEEYLGYLEKLTRELPEQLEAREKARLEWGRLRNEQTGTDHFDYGKYSNSTESQYIKEQILSPLLSKLPADVRTLLGDIPIGVLPLRVVNAHTMKAPNGDPIIIIDRGLLGLGNFYIESQTAHSIILKTQGKKEAEMYLLKAYKFIVNYFSQSGNLSIPLSIKKLPVEAVAMSMLLTKSMETFVVAHELAHIYAGHLNSTPTRVRNIVPNRDVPIEFYQLSHQHEFEADSIAWDWYHLPPGKEQAFPVVPSAGPGYLFLLAGLVETNLSIPDQYSTHPSAIDRLSSLIENNIENVPSELLFVFDGLLEGIQTSPNFSQMPPDLLELLDTPMNFEVSGDNWNKFVTREPD